MSNSVTSFIEEKRSDFVASFDEEKRSEDNIVFYLFFTIFKKFNNFQEITIKEILNSTFYSSHIHELIANVITLPINYVKDLVEDPYYIELILKIINDDPLYVDIIMDRHESFITHANRASLVDPEFFNLIIVNRRFDMLKHLVEKGRQLGSYLLIPAAKFGYEDIYFYLRNLGIRANMSVMNNAVLSSSLNIIKDINKTVAFSPTNLQNIFRKSHDDIVEYVLSVQPKEKFKIKNEYYEYWIIKNKFELLEKYSDRIIWEKTFYYSAILSGSIKMLTYVNQKMEINHDILEMDRSHYHHNNKFPLIADMKYYYASEERYSNCMNYAVQSKNINMVNYIYHQGYHITVSNIMSAIKCGTVEMLEFLLQKYQSTVPYYTCLYFSPHSYCEDKIAKMKLVAHYNNLYLINRDYAMEVIHEHIVAKLPYDINYDHVDLEHCLSQHAYFKKNNYLFLLKFYLQTEQINDAIQFLAQGHTEEEWEIMSDMIYLFGTTEQIIKIQKIFNIFIFPTIDLAIELIKYRAISKLIILTKNNKIKMDHKEKIDEVLEILNNELLNKVFQNYFVEPNDAQTR